MKKFLLIPIIALLLVSCAVPKKTIVKSQIQTEKTIKTRIFCHNHLYGEAHIEQEKTSLFFRCVEFQNITIYKGIELTPSDTEKLYQALSNVKGKDGQTVDIETLDHKTIHIAYHKYMFTTNAYFDILDKEKEAVYHIFCLPQIQLDRLFNKV